MKLSILKETAAHEKRVSATPDLVKKYIQLGFDVFVEKSAGLGAGFPDGLYDQAGAKISDSLKECVKDADIILRVGPPANASEIALYKKGAILIGILNPYAQPAFLDAYEQAGVIACAMEFVPRITRAQSMDILSSQANLAGYQAVLEAATYFGRAFPMMMTAAGTIPPARVMVMGAGVAGLQAIATAKRLGAVVCATDVRPASKEQVESLGATFVMVESEETQQAETKAGYAKEMSDAYKKAQAELIAQTLPKQDVVITTALIPGKKAPILITEAMVKSMKPGSVIVDMAAVQGGNCAVTKPDEIVTLHGVHIIGYTNLVSHIAQDASTLYAKNLNKFIELLVDSKTGKLAPNWEDEILKSVILTREGKIVHPNFGAKLVLAAPEGDKVAKHKKTSVKTKTKTGS